MSSRAAAVQDRNLQRNNSLPQCRVAMSEKHLLLSIPHRAKRKSTGRTAVCGRRYVGRSGSAAKAKLAPTRSRWRQNYLRDAASDLLAWGSKRRVGQGRIFLLDGIAKVRSGTPLHACGRWGASTGEDAPRLLLLPFVCEACSIPRTTPIHTSCRMSRSRRRKLDA